MCRLYAITPIQRCSDEQDLWDDEKEDEWNGCCEDPYDDEDNEREWCD